MTIGWEFHYSECNMCAFLLLDTFTWEEISNFTTEDGNAEASGIPAALCERAGHIAAVVGTKMYVWSGREGHKKMLNHQVS